jgi:predicted RNA-binding protein
MMNGEELVNADKGIGVKIRHQIKWYLKLS